MQVRIEQYLGLVEPRYWLALGVLALGIVLAFVVGRVNRRVLESAGVPEAIEGTAFERTAREFGTSTVTLIVQLGSWFIVILSLIVALTVADIRYVSLFWSDVASFLPNLFFAVLILIVGIVLGDKVELLIAERLRSVKVPEANILPNVAKYSVIFIAVLVALGQVGVAVKALIVLLRVYALGLIVFTAIALWDVLPSGAAGIYLLLTQPFGIGDEVEIGGKRGIVQEVDVFVTHVETDGEEYIIPNRKVFRDGIVRIRE